MTRRISIHKILFACAAVAVASTAFAAPGGGTNGTTERISLDSAGQEASAASLSPSISRDGTRIAFHTQAALVPLDTNGQTDVYVYDRSSGVMTLASRSTGGALGNDSSFEASISGDGQWVAFSTRATNFYGFDNNGLPDVMLKNLATGVLVRVSATPGSLFAGSGESRRPAVSYDGRFVAFDTTSTQYSAQDTNAYLDVYVRDFHTDQIHYVSRGLAGLTPNSSSHSPSISDDGRFVAFESSATNLVAGDANGQTDVFVRDMWGGLGTELISRVPNGAQGNEESWEASISADGRYVSFTTRATNFVFGDTNASADVFVYDRTLDVLRLVSKAMNGGFPGPGNSSGSRISGDGRFVAFMGAAQGLALPATNHISIYVHDLKRAENYLVSTATGPATVPNSQSLYPAIDGDGTTVAFQSFASNLVQGDVNGQTDVFVRDLYADPFTYCTASVTSAGCEPTISTTGLPRASQNSGFVVNCAQAPNKKFGLMFYGFNGSQSVPFGAGVHCVITPTLRTAPMYSGGTPFGVNDCSGSFSIDLNAYAKGLLGSAPAPELTQVGQQVNVQFWGRDPQGPLATTFLSNALEYVVGP